MDGCQVIGEGLLRPVAPQATDAHPLSQGERAMNQTPQRNHDGSPSQRHAATSRRHVTAVESGLCNPRPPLQAHARGCRLQASSSRPIACLAARHAEQADGASSRAGRRRGQRPRAAWASTPATYAPTRYARRPRQTKAITRFISSAASPHRAGLSCRHLDF